MLEDIRKEIEETIERFHRYDYDGLPLQPIEKKYLAHVVPMLSLIDEQKEVINTLREAFKDLENVVNRVDEEMKPSE